jgi:hypothetical protein
MRVAGHACCFITDLMKRPDRGVRPLNLCGFTGWVLRGLMKLRLGACEHSQRRPASAAMGYRIGATGRDCRTSRLHGLSGPKVDDWRIPSHGWRRSQRHLEASAKEVSGGRPRAGSQVARTGQVPHPESVCGLSEGSVMKNAVLLTRKLLRISLGQ